MKTISAQKGVSYTKANLGVAELLYQTGELSFHSSHSEEDKYLNF